MYMYMYVMYLYMYITSCPRNCRHGKQGLEIKSRLGKISRKCGTYMCSGCSLSVATTFNFTLYMYVSIRMRMIIIMRITKPYLLEKFKYCH